MRISLIFAMDRTGVIGYEGDLPWHLPDDLKRFKEITMGKPIIMGRKTYDSIGQSLPGRRNIVMTRNRNFQADGCEVVYSIGEALTAAIDFDEVMVIGGAVVFEGFLPMASRMYVTLLEAEFDGDVYFPNIDWEEWLEVSRESLPVAEEQPFAYHYLIYERL